MQSSHQLTEQEAAIWNAAIDFYRKQEELFAVVAQITDLAEQAFLDLMIKARENSAYSERIEAEGPVYARNVLIQYAARFATI